MLTKKDLKCKEKNKVKIIKSKNGRVSKYYG